MILGVAGALLPVLPGPILSYCAIVLLHLSRFGTFSVNFLVAYGVIVAIITLLDLWIPIGATKAFGASRFGTWGAGIGVIAGIFIFPPVGIILFPFTGALAGELIGGKNINKSFRGAIGSFLGFILGVVINLAVCGILAYYFLGEIIRYF